MAVTSVVIPERTALTASILIAVTGNNDAFTMTAIMMPVIIINGDRYCYPDSGASLSQL